MKIKLVTIVPYIYFTKIILSENSIQFYIRCVKMINHDSFDKIILGIICISTLKLIVDSYLTQDA